ncbi:hypothetical protein BDV18DRAFT_107602 [Aspergillus unguis]
MSLPHNPNLVSSSSNLTRRLCIKTHLVIRSFLVFLFCRTAICDHSLHQYQRYTFLVSISSPHNTLDLAPCLLQVFVCVCIVVLHHRGYLPCMFKASSQLKCSQPTRKYETLYLISKTTIPAQRDSIRPYRGLIISCNPSWMFKNTHPQGLTKNTKKSKLRN